MLVLILKNFFLFNYLYSIFNFNKSYLKNFLLKFNKVLSFKLSKILSNFKKILFIKILKRKKIINLINYYSIKIFIINKIHYSCFNFINFFKFNIFYSTIFKIKKININLNNYIFELCHLNYFLKIIIFIF